MRLKRTQNDFRVTELLDDDKLGGDGSFAVYRVTKRGLTTFEAADVLAQGAGVERSAVAYAGLKDKDGVTSQIMTVEGGKPVTFRDKALTIRPLGRSSRAIESTDSNGNSFEIVVRDLEGDDMRRIRVNMEELKNLGIPNYFDDQRFGCLRHGQGFVVRHLLKGNYELALRALLAAPSRYGAEKVEMFKKGIQHRWGDWSELADYCRGRRGATVFEHLKENPDDFKGAMERGISTRERTIHLFAYQSYLWNQAAGFHVQALVGEEDSAWLPCDAASLPVYRKMDPAQVEQLKGFQLPLLGPDRELSAEVEQLYRKVFRHEGLPMSAFLELDIAGFRPQMEDRPFLVFPEYLRGAPAEDDEIYRRRRKMRVRFSLPRGHYATLVVKRLVMPTEKDYAQLRIWVARHPLDWPDDQGKLARVADHEDRRHWSERARGGRRPAFVREPEGDRGGFRRDDRREDRGHRGGGGYRRDDRRDDRGGGYRRDGGRREEKPAFVRKPEGGGRGRGREERPHFVREPEDDRGRGRDRADRRDQGSKKPAWNHAAKRPTWKREDRDGDRDHNRDRDRDRSDHRDGNRDRGSRPSPWGSSGSKWDRPGDSPREERRGDRHDDARDHAPRDNPWKKKGDGDDA